MASTMIPLRTTALIATMSLLGAITPAAFAQSNSVTIGDISQSQSGSASASSFLGDASASVTNEQGFCINIAQAAASVFSGASASTSQNAGGDIDCS
jgi:hypothetical protein